MKDQLDVARDTLGRIAAVFLILWFISAVTNVLGRYEYEVEFLQIAVGFYLLSRVPTAFRRRYTAGRKVQKFFTNVGWPLIGLWIAFKIFRWIGWFGAMDIEVEIDYLLVAGIVFLLIGYAVKSMRHKAGYWAARSVLFAIGGAAIFFWILIKVFSIFPEYADYALAASIAAIGLGFILGGLRRPPAFFVEIGEEAEEPPEVTEEVRVTEEDVSIGRNGTQVKIEKGSLFVPIITGKGKEIGGIYFGEGSYSVDAKIKNYQGTYRGLTVVSGREWDEVLADQKFTGADEDAFENIGLKREEVLEIARLQVKGKVTDEVRRKLRRVQVDLPFVKVRETPDGEYVKVGPIEVDEIGGKEHVRVGPWEFRESGHRHRLAARGLIIQIRSKDEDITISTDGKTVLTKGDMQITVNDRVTVRDETTDLVMDENRKVLHSGRIKLICKENKRILNSDGFELFIRENSGTIKRNGKSTVIKDEKTLEEIRAEIDSVADELIKEVLDRGELKELDALIKRFEQELS
jgi:hypothetical protein